MLAPWRVVEVIKGDLNLQLALCICRFCIHAFNQPWIGNIWKKKKSRKFQKAKLESAAAPTIYVAFTLLLTIVYITLSLYRVLQSISSWLNSIRKDCVGYKQTLPHFMWETRASANLSVHQGGWDCFPTDTEGWLCCPIYENSWVGGQSQLLLPFLGGLFTEKIIPE